jgi:tape measure domain-containing protein
MSGVIIDVKTQRAEQAKRDLNALNKSLADMTLKGAKAQKELNSIDAKSFRELTSNVKSSNIALKQFQTSSNNALSGINKNTSNINRNFSQMKSLIIGATAAFITLGSVKAFLAMGDNLAIVNNRIKLVTTGTEELIRKQRILFGVAQESRTALGDTAKTYATLVKSLAKSDIGDKRILNVTRAIQQASVQATGSVEGMKAAMEQLNQGLASGVVRGEEFNSVNEQFSYLMDKVAQSLGKTKGQLRALANEGKLTTDVFFGAVEKAAKSIEKNMANATILAAQGFNTLRESLKFYIGDLNTYLGVSAKVGKSLADIGNNFGANSNNIIAKLATIRESYRNYLADLRDYRKKFLSKDFMSKGGLFALDGETNQNVRNLKRQAAEVVGVVDDMFKKTQPKMSWMEKLFGRLKMPKADDDSFFAAGNIRQSVEDVINLMAELVTTTKAAGMRLKALLPNILLPITTITNTFLASTLITSKTWSTEIYKAILPGIRRLETAKEFMSFFFLGDNRVGRGVSSLFDADNLNEFNKGLAQINKDLMMFNGEIVRFDSTSYFISEKVRLFKSMRWAIEDGLIALGIMDNKLIRIRDLKLDRLFETFRLIGDVFKRVYDDQLAPTINLFVYKFTVAALVVAKTFSQALSNTFNGNTGREIGYKLSRGIAESIKFIGKAVSNISLSLKAPDSFTRNLALSVVENIKEAFVGLPGFVIGLLKGLLQTIGELLSEIDFNQLAKNIASGIGKGISWMVDMFAKLLSYASSFLGRTESRIEQFGNNVKQFFYDIWDAVIGHSYWPDTIDGILDYTKKLFGAEKDVQSFREKILDVFKSIASGVKDYISNVGGVLETIYLSVKKVDWGNAAKIIAASLGTVLFAAFNLLRHTGPFGIIQYFLSAYLIGILDFSTGNLLAKIGPDLGAKFGDALYEMFKYAAAGAAKGLILFASTFSGFVTSFVSNFFSDLAGIVGINISGVFKDILRSFVNLVPLIGNEIVVGMATLTAVLYATTKSARGKIDDVLFGEKGVNKKRGGGMLGPLLATFSGPVLEQFQGRSIVPKLVSNLIDSKLFAALAAGSMIAGLSGAVSLVTASEAFLGFGALAIFGGAGGARAGKEAFQGATIFLGKVSKEFLLAMARWSLPEQMSNKFADIMGRGFSFKTGSGPIRNALKGVFKEFDSVASNIASNRKAYGENKISFSEMLFGSSRQGPGLDGKPIARDGLRSFKDSFKRLGTALKADQSIILVTKGIQQIRDSIGMNMQGVFDKLKSVRTGASSGLAAFAGNFVSNLNTNFNRVFTALRTNLNKLGAILNGSTFLKFGIFAAAIFGFSGIANAATGASDAVSGLASNFTGLAVAITTIVAALTALNFAKKMRATFVNSKEYSIDSFVDPRVAELRARKQTRVDSMVMKYRQLPKDEQKLSPRAYRRLLQDREDKRLDKAKDRLTAFITPRAATQARSDSLRHITDLRDRIDNLSKSTIFSAEWRDMQIANITRIALAAKNAILATSIQNLPGAIGRTTIGAGRKLQETALNPIWLGALPGRTARGAKLMLPTKANEKLWMRTLFSGGAGGGAAKGIGNVLKGIFGGVGRLVMSGGRLLFTAFTSIASLIGLPFAGIIAGATALGGVLVGLFGPFDSFMDNLKWGADQIKGWFGFSPSSDRGMASKLAKDYGQYDIDGKKIDVSKQITSIDYDKLSKKQKKAVEEFLQQNDEALRSLESKSQLEKLNVSDKAEMRRLLDSRSQVLSRFPGFENSKADSEFAVRNAGFRNTMTDGRSENMMDNISRFIFGPTGSKTFRNIDRLPLRGATAAADFIGTLPGKAANRISNSTPAQFAKYVAYEFKRAPLVLDAKELAKTGARNFVKNTDFVIDKINKRIADPQSTFKNAKFANANEFSKLSDKYFDSLDPEDQEKIVKMRSKFTDQVDKVADLRNGFDSTKFKNQEEYNKALKKEEETLKKLEMQYKVLQSNMAVKGVREFRKDLLAADLKTIGSRGAALGVDYGPDGANFAGGELGKKYNILNEKQLANATKLIENAVTLEERARGLAERLSATSREKFNQEYADNGLLLGGRTQQLTGLSDVFNANDIQSGLMGNDRLAKRFESAADSYARL